ncbi:MAG: HAD family phosphatase [Gemmiger sp.]|nr:HAD family phosphatase [Gemmiger sp.]
MDEQSVLKLVLVDLDGTLFDTVAVNAASYRSALQEQGYTVTDAYYAAHCNGGYYQDFLRPLMGGNPTPEAVEQVHNRKKALYAACLGAARKNTGLFAILQALRGQCPLGLVTTGSRRNATEILTHFGCLDWFDLVITQEDVVRNKPDPEGYCKAMAHFGVPAANTLIFEDSGPGLAAARASGAQVMGVSQF